MARRRDTARSPHSCKLPAGGCGTPQEDHFPREKSKRVVEASLEEAYFPTAYEKKLAMRGSRNQSPHDFAKPCLVLRTSRNTTTSHSRARQVLDELTTSPQLRVRQLGATGGLSMRTETEALGQAALEDCLEDRSAANNPFVGLRAFTQADADNFYGRDELIEQLVSIVAGEARFTAVVGPSGSGKSSLVQAGLIPALRKLRSVGDRADASGRLPVHRARGGARRRRRGSAVQIDECPGGRRLRTVAERVADPARRQRHDCCW